MQAAELFGIGAVTVEVGKQRRRVGGQQSRWVNQDVDVIQVYYQVPHILTKKTEDHLIKRFRLTGDNVISSEEYF